MFPPRASTRRERVDEVRNKAAYLYLTAAFFIWGSFYVVSKYALAVIPPITALLFRYIIGSAALFFVARKIGFKKIRRQHIKYFLAIGALGYALSVTFQMFTIKLMDSSVASLVNCLNPVTISVLAAVFLKEKLTIRKILSLAVSLAGVYMILGGGSGDIRIAGIFTSLAAVLFWSVSSVLVRRIASEYDPILIALYSLLISFIFLIPASAVELHFASFTFTPPAAAALLYMGIVCTAGAHTLWNKSLSMADASTCSMFYPIQPLTSAAMGVLLLHEALTKNYIIGAILISGGIAVGLAGFRGLRVRQSENA